MACQGNSQCNGNCQHIQVVEVMKDESEYETDVGYAEYWNRAYLERAIQKALVEKDRVRRQSALESELKKDKNKVQTGADPTKRQTNANASAKASPKAKNQEKQILIDIDHKGEPFILSLRKK